MAKNLRLTVEQARQWITSYTDVAVPENYLNELCTGIVLCSVVNKFSPGKIDVHGDAVSDDFAALENIENFLQSCKEIGVDENHLFAAEILAGKRQFNEDELNALLDTITALKFVTEENVSTLEQQNKWTKDAAETRAKQEKIAKGYAKTENKGLNDVTEAVRAFKNRTNDVKDLRYKKDGQQKWNLFETHYQREKGITVEESLKEIEEYSKTGAVPAPITKKVELTVGGSAFRNRLEGKIEEHEDRIHGHTKTAGKFSGTLVKEGAVVCTSGSSKVVKGQGDLEVQPTMGGNAGEAFFERFKKQEDKKYKPGKNK